MYKTEVTLVKAAATTQVEFLDLPNGTWFRNIVGSIYLKCNDKTVYSPNSSSFVPYPDGGWVTPIRRITISVK